MICRKRVDRLDGTATNNDLIFRGVIMVKTICLANLRVLSHWTIFSIILILVSGCQTKGPPLSQNAAAMVIVVQDIVAHLSTALTGPVADGDIAEINVILKNYFSGAGLEPRLPVTYAGVTNNQGIILTAYPPIKSIGSDFSKYGVMARVLQNKGIHQEKLFLDNYPEIWVICAPLVNHGKVVGTVWLALDAEKVRKTWEISSETFLGIDFNK
jgi:hypothetical protein